MFFHDNILTMRDIMQQSGGRSATLKQVHTLVEDKVQQDT
jgi:predicted metal-dependent enzyme (double-stranded beta helix superfamily)